MIEIRPAKEIRGQAVLPPGPDYFFLASLVAAAAAKPVRFAAAPQTPLAAAYREILSPLVSYATEGEKLVATPALDNKTSPVIFASVEDLPYRELTVFLLLGMGRTVTIQSLSPKRLDSWQKLAAEAGCSIESQNLESGALGLRLAPQISFRMPVSPVPQQSLHAALGLAVGLRRSVDFETDYLFSTPLRHLLSAVGFALSVRSNTDSKPTGVASRGLRLLQPKKKDDKGLAFTVKADFSVVTNTPVDITLPGDDMLAGLLVAAKSLVQKGALVVENVPLELWCGATIDYVRKMGCKIGVQETGETSFGKTGMVQLQRFELAGRRTECVPLYQYATQLPAMVVLACFSQGQSVFRGLDDLRNDEPDQIEQILAGIRTMGGRHGEMPDGIVVDGAREYDGFDLDRPLPANLAGAFAIAGLHCTGSTTVDDTRIAQRWPNFAAMLDAICEYRK